jgi:hypothetical protein
MGPIYFGARGSPTVFVLVWAAIWTSLRFVATWKPVYAALQERDGDKPPSWFVRHPSVLMPGVFLVTLGAFETAHVLVYSVIWRLVQSSN